MNAKKSILAAAVISAFTFGIETAQAAQVAYANFTSAGSVSNLTLLTAEGMGCTANCDSFTPTNGGHGYTFGGANNVAFTWDGSVFTSPTDYIGPGSASNATLSSLTWILGRSWVAHDVQIFGPGTYNFDTSLGGGNPESGTMSMTVGAGQLGVHMLWDWNGNNNIDIANVWNINSKFSNCGATNTDNTITMSNCLWTDAYGNPAGNNANTVFQFASTDNNGDGTLGIPMAQGGPFVDSQYGGFNFNFNLHGSMTVVPIPSAIWLFGSGLVGLLGISRKRKIS